MTHKHKYEHLSHTHCFDQEERACGILGKHCCLCDICHQPKDKTWLMSEGEKPKIKKGCTSIDCPERTGGECNAGEEDIDSLVRDLTRVGSIPKSEAKRRILELLNKRELPPAIGVSQWLNYGEKYGYDKFLMSKNIGMLRQWLNEDRITDPKKMVTNEQIEKFLK